MKTEKIYSRAYRTRIVWWTTATLAFRYMTLLVLGRFLGRNFLEKRLDRLHARAARQLRRTFLKLGGLFIKIGQLVSILSSFLPETIRKPLEDFQDQAPARPFDEVRKTIESEFGKPLSALFARFDETPLASASIGQVHRATLFSGESVVVKIQHAHIPHIAQTDLELFENVTNLLGRLFKMKGLEHVAGQVRQMIEAELDYTKEAKYMRLIGENLASVPGVIVPAIYDEYCTSKIITSQYYEGAKINQTDQLDQWQIDRTDLARRFLNVCCHMVLKDGIYHADPHPGNILVMPDGQMVWLDFGAISVVHPQMKTGLSRLIEAVTKADMDEIIDAMQYMGFVARGPEATRFSEKVFEFVQDFLQNEIQMESFNFKDIQVNFDPARVMQLFEIISIRELSNAFQIPKDYILLNRMILLAAGISAELAPTLNPLDVVRPWFREFVLEDLHDLPRFILDFVKKNLANVVTLPLELRKVLTKARRGELVIQQKKDVTLARLNFWLAQQFFWTIFLLAALVLTILRWEPGGAWRPWLLGADTLFLFLWLRAFFQARKWMNW